MLWAPRDTHGYAAHVVGEVTHGNRHPCSFIGGSAKSRNDPQQETEYNETRPTGKQITEAVKGNAHYSVGVLF